MSGADYVRNWIELGTPFVGGWDPSRGFAWWQEPGLRMPRDFAVFGEALVRPIYAATTGFWDGLYSTLWLDGFLSGMTRLEAAPPWNYDLVLATAPLALPLTLACVAGAAGALRRDAPWRAPRLFAGACLALYLAAMLHLFATLPVYSTVKASYTLGLLPCYGVLAAAGAAPLLRKRASRAVVAGGAAAWAVAAYGGYFAL